MKNFKNYLSLVLILFALWIPGCTSKGPQAVDDPSTSTSSGTTRGTPMMTPLRTQAYQFSSQRFSMSLCVDHMVVFDTQGRAYFHYVNASRVTIDASGVDLSDVIFPKGAYERMDLHVTRACPEASITVDNDHGSFSTFNVFVLTFWGHRVETGDGTPWILNFQPIVDHLQSVQNNNQLVDKATQSSGSF